MLLLDLKKVKKAAETVWIQNVVAKTIASQVDSNYQKAETTSTEECSSLKKDMENESEEITNSLKGNFGQRVREVIEIEAEKLNDLSK